jgi:hypothetical protein
VKGISAAKWWEGVSADVHDLSPVSEEATKYSVALRQMQNAYV